MRKRERGERSRETGRRRGQARGREEGQAMIEMTICIVFLLLVVVALFEFAMVFYSYICLLNAAREGAVYASIYPDVADGDSSEHWLEFVETTQAEALASGLLTDTLVILTPQKLACDANGMCPIRCVLNYEVMNEAQGLFLPLMGNLGLVDSVSITAREDMAIRIPEE